MARGYTGESKSDKAYNRMDKAMERSERHSSRTETPRKSENPIITQLKTMFPDTWQDELKALQRDWAAKTAAGDTGTQIKSADEYRKL